jgi:hypothetical protein
MVIAVPAERDRERAADVPEHADEGDGGERGRRMPEAKSTGASTATRRSSATAYSGLSWSPAHEVQLVVAAAAQPAVERVRVQPGAPTPLQGHPGVHRDRRERDVRRGEGEEDERLLQHGRGVAPVEGVEHRAVPDVQPVLQSEPDEGQRGDRERQDPRRRPRAFPPKAEGGVPEDRQQIAAVLVLAGFLVPGLRHATPAKHGAPSVANRGCAAPATRSPRAQRAAPL